MVGRRNNEWEENRQVYSPDQIGAVVEYCGIEVSSETNTHFIGYCPFHFNADSPAFEVDKYKGLYCCFNPSCDAKGNIEQLLMRTKALNMFEARRLITKYKSGNSDFQSRLNKIKESTPDFMQFPVEPVERMANELWGSEGFDYLVNERHFDKETLEHFGIGYSAKKQMTIVPMHDPKGMLIGFIGRSIKEKAFKNSDKLPKSKTLWNFHRAKRHGETVIVVESSFDAMRVHQAGYQNVVATLGGHLSEHQANLLNKTFNTVVVMTDFDRKIAKPNCRLCTGSCDGHRAGRDLGRAIIATLNNKRVRWAAYDNTCVYPHGAKDVGDMTDEEIRQCLRNAVPNFEYISWDVESMNLVAS